MGGSPSSKTWYSIAVLLVILVSALQEIRAQTCEDDQDWCSSIENACFSEATKIYCRKTCDICINKDCPECEHGCTSDESEDVFTCICRPGFRLRKDGKTCGDIDECEENSRACPPDKVCVNRDGSYECNLDPCLQFHNRGYVRSNSYPDECCKMKKGKCGQNNQNLNAAAFRIFDGQNATVGTWPWHASIIRRGELCGAALITDDWVLTAAQCFNGITNGRRVNINIYFGAVHRRILNDKSTLQQRKIVQVYKHERFRFPLHDIAVARLDRPITRTSYVYPICLPGGELPEPGTRCFATGIGISDADSGKPAEILQHVELPLVDMNTCQNAYKKSTQSVNRNTMVCAGDKSQQKGACEGDSGGPLVCQRCDSCDWFILGIVSFGGRCGSAGLPNVFTKVSHYEKWIAAKTRKIKVTENVCKRAQWTSWGRWTKCSKSCETGFQSRIRICENGEVGLPGCLGQQFDRTSCSTQPCGIGPWATWSSCSQSCGGGLQTRTTTCITSNCEKLSETKDCNAQKCPEWRQWTQWTTCSKTCESGQRMRQRTCSTGENRDCEGSSVQEDDCNTEPCPKWGTWSNWNECSENCGGGQQKSERQCIGGRVGIECTGEKERTRKCNTEKCKGQFTAWSTWSSCSKSCDSGISRRHRDCPADLCESDDFELANTDRKSCLIINCEGMWSDWSSWSSCTQSCGGGNKTKRRSCLDGLDCSGPEAEDVACNTQECVGTWSTWLPWSACSVTCGTGSKIRGRACENGVNCPGNPIESDTCNSTPCPTWSEWQNWSNCDATCGEAARIRERSCMHGNDCSGLAIEIGFCDNRPCPLWSVWSEWSPCDATCEGNRIRTRSCENGNDCPGPGLPIEIGNCNTNPCPTWSVWADWSLCDATCGEGNRVRKRICENGSGCPGNATDSETCTLKDCPTWSEWLDWEECSQTCGGGNRSRSRTCGDSERDEGECPGVKTETENCAMDDCPSQCSGRCVDQAEAGWCLTHSDWMERTCHPDCCRRAPCSDQSSQCEEIFNQFGEFYCSSERFLLSCPVTCGLCP